MNWKKFALMALVGIAIFFGYQKCNNSDGGSDLQSEQIIEALQDTTKTFKAEDGKTVSYIKTIEAPKKVFVKIDTVNDSLLQRIRELTDEVLRLEDAVVMLNETRFIKEDIPTETVVEYQDSLDKVGKELIKAEYHDEWVDVEVEVNPDEESLSIDFSTENVLEIWHERSKGKLFRPGHVEVFVKNENPYVRTPQLRSYKVSMKKPRRFGLGLLAGVGVDRNFKPGPLLGGGVFFRIL